MNLKIILPIAVIASVIVTAGFMFAIGFNQPEVTTSPNLPQVTTSPDTPQVVYVEKTASEFFEGTQEIRKISFIGRIGGVTVWKILNEIVHAKNRNFLTPNSR